MATTRNVSTGQCKQFFFLVLIKVNKFLKVKTGLEKKTRKVDKNDISELNNSLESLLITKTAVVGCLILKQRGEVVRGFF